MATTIAVVIPTEQYEPFALYCLDRGMTISDGTRLAIATLIREPVPVVVEGRPKQIISTKKITYRKKRKGEPK